MTIIISYGPIFGWLLILGLLAFIVWWTRQRKGCDGVLVYLIISPLVFAFFIFAVVLTERILGR